VVVYRLPLGISLVRPPSHCPACKRPIRWFDNVPVFGWILLRGRCRSCRSPISVRYPLVEAATAAIFGVLALVEYTSPSIYQYQPLGICLYHLVLLCTLLCAALIEADDNRPPLRLFLPALVAGITVPLFWVVPRLGQPCAGLRLPTWAAGAIDGLAGLAAGVLLVLLAGAATWALGGRPHARRRIASGLAKTLTGWAIALGCAGLFLGWEAASVLLVATTMLNVAMLNVAFLAPRRVWLGLFLRPSMSLFIVTMAWILLRAMLVPP
jgi:leader peptidase (prepilin peptidase) / N-methyltransferase